MDFENIRNLELAEDLISELGSFYPDLFASDPTGNVAESYYLVVSSLSALLTEIKENIEDKKCGM